MYGYFYLNYTNGYNYGYIRWDYNRGYLDNLNNLTCEYKYLLIVFCLKLLLWDCEQTLCFFQQFFIPSTCHFWFFPYLKYSFFGIFHEICIAINVFYNKLLSEYGGKALDAMHGKIITLVHRFPYSFSTFHRNDFLFWK